MQVANNQADTNTEVRTDEQQEEVAVTEQRAEDDLAAGFNKVHAVQGTTAASPEKKKTEEKTEEKVEEKPAGNVPVKVEEPAATGPLIAGMTEEQLKAALGKGAAWEVEVRKVFSKIGEMNRTVQELKAAAGKKGATRKITAETLKRVNEELPGLGEALAADLSSLFEDADAATEQAAAAAAAQSKPFDQEAFFAEKVGPALETFKAQANEQAQNDLLEFMHPNFAATLQTPEFSAWLKTLPEARQKEVVESPRAVVAGAAISQFKDWQAKALKAQERSKTRLEGAITPKGSGAPASQPAQDDEADFAKGYKKVSAKKA